MQIVIDIPKSIFDMTKEMGCIIDADNKVVADAIIDGTPLPKGHGRLIDADAICEDVISALGIKDERYLLEAERSIYKRIKQAPTIIEADKEDEKCQDI